MKRPAPGDLELLQAFVNSCEDEDDGTRGGFASAERARVWLIEHELLDGSGTVVEPERLRLIAVREALRALLRSNNGAPPDARAVALLNRAAARAPLTLAVTADGSVWLNRAAEGVDGAIAALLAIVFTAGVDGTWERLKVCRSSTCRMAFYDSSKNHSATWCSMRVCGNRAKVRAYQKRRRAVAV